MCRARLFCRREYDFESIPVLGPGHDGSTFGGSPLASRAALAVIAALEEERRLLINVTAGNVVRLLPPLVVSAADADRVVDLLHGAVLEFSAEGK